MMPGGLFQRSPNCRVHLLGFESTTWALASAGWEMQIDESPWPQDPFVERTLMMRHPKSAVVIIARQRGGNLMASAFDSEREVLFVAERVLHSKCLIEMVPTLSFHRIDASQDWPTDVGGLAGRERRSIESLGFFRKWEDEVEEIIVDQASVSELMDQIRKLQEPELAAIRERNRARDRRSQSVNDERVRAQVIAIAA